MAQLGILTTTYRYSTLDDTLDAVVRSGLRTVQFEPASAGIAPFPAHIDAALCLEVRQALASRGLTMAAISGTVNMIHPDPEERQSGLRRVLGVIDACAAFGTSVVTLCTGTRDPQSMWRRHPANDTEDAWTDLVASMREVVRRAEERGVTLAFEPEVNNVVDSARKARRLLDEIGSSALKVVMDPANIFHAGELARMHEMLEEAFALLGSDIALAHAKDLDHDGDAGHLPAGRGVLDYQYYLSLLQRTGFAGALVLHGLQEEDVASCVAFLRQVAPPQLWSSGAAPLEGRDGA
jgi:sugar phosphate isomerase/epimerase